ncbi:MAG: thioredoxin-disulfide reductase [Planctomycetota bacterium]|nr:thioredoxin-disulfide reductase [Planctomycetota bacterium]
MADTVRNLVIVGSGPAGWTAAIYAARASIDPVVYVGVPKQDPGPILPGGQLMLTTEVENYPGFPEGIAGPEMMGKFQAQAERFGTKVVGEDITRCDFSKDGSAPHVLHTSSGAEVHAHAVIIATGATANWLGLESEMRLATAGGGVSACAVCDGALPVFRDQELAVVGGGDTAMEEATYLTKFASTVHLIHRRDKLRASKVMQERFLSKPNAKVHWNKQVVDCLSDGKEGMNEKIRAVVLEDTQTGERSELVVKGLFVAIGHTPATKFLKDSGLEFDDAGYLALRSRHSATNIDGVFAAGDIADGEYRQAITAAGMGCQAALDAERWLGGKGLV